jgi:hypothetical protein
MNSYLLLFRGGDSTAANNSPEEKQAHMQKWFVRMGGSSEKGIMAGAEPLHPTGKTIKGTGKVVSDGPFMENKEMVGGYLICKADTYEAAVEIAKRCPILKFAEGNVEVREIQKMDM